VPFEYDALCGNMDVGFGQEVHVMHGHTGCLL
jgi:hypothetical protein